MATSAVGATVAAPSIPAKSKEQKNGQDDAAEFSVLSSAKLTLADVIGAAEKDVGSKAVNAGQVDNRFDPVFAAISGDLRSAWLIGTIKLASFHLVKISGELDTVQTDADGNSSGGK